MQQVKVLGVIPLFLFRSKLETVQRYSNHHFLYKKKLQQYPVKTTKI